jgi:nitric oxide synthase-interacting protein
MANGKNKELPSFWVPSQLPNAKITKVLKPDSTIYCPVSGQPFKAKDLIEVKFTLVNDPDEKKSLIARENRYMCPVTHDILSNSVPCAILRPTGDVVTMECVEKIIKKDWIHPLTGLKLTEKDIIPMERVSTFGIWGVYLMNNFCNFPFQGGTGYATTNTALEGREKRPALQT